MGSFCIQCDLIPQLLVEIVILLIVYSILITNLFRTELIPQRSVQFLIFNPSFLPLMPSHIHSPQQNYKQKQKQTFPNMCSQQRSLIQQIHTRYNTQLSSTTLWFNNSIEYFHYFFLHLWIKVMQIWNQLNLQLLQVELMLLLGCLHFFNFMSALVIFSIFFIIFRELCSGVIVMKEAAYKMLSFDTLFSIYLAKNKICFPFAHQLPAKIIAQKNKYQQTPIQKFKKMQSLYSTKQLSYGQSTTMEPYSYEQPTFRSTKLQPQVYNQPYESTIRYPQQNRMSSYSFSMENKNQPIGICGGNQGRSHLANVSKCSSVSGDSLLKFDQPDCTRQLAELQHKLTQQILILREEKLTLMEQQNSLTQNRYKLQRQLNKLKKKERQSEIPINQTKQEDQIQKLYLEQVKKRKQLQMKKETRQEDIEYENLTSEQCEIMQKILNLKQTNNELMIQLHKQQEATNDKQQKKQLKPPTPIQPQSYLQSLHTKKQHLLTTLLSHTRHQNLTTSIQTLLHTNQQLHITINKYIYRQKHRLQLLRDKVKQEQEDKKNMLEELVKMKSQLKSLKLENQEFRRAMIYFRF